MEKKILDNSLCIHLFRQVQVFLLLFLFFFSISSCCFFYFFCVCALYFGEEEGRAAILLSCCHIFFPTTLNYWVNNLNHLIVNLFVVFFSVCAVGRACWGKSFKLWSPNGSLCCANQRLYPTKRRVGCICVSKSEVRIEFPNF